MSSTDSQEIEQHLNQKGYSQVQFVNNQWWGIPKGYVMPVPISIEELQGLASLKSESAARTLRDRKNLKFRLQRALEICLHRILDLILGE